MPTPRHPAQTKPEPVMFEIDGKDAPFELSFNDICEIEERLNAGVSEIARDLGANPNAAKLRKIVALGLSTKDEIYSEAEAGAAIAQHGMVKFIEAIGVYLEFAIAGTQAFRAGLVEGFAGKKPSTPRAK